MTEDTTWPVFSYVWLDPYHCFVDLTSINYTAWTVVRLFVSHRGQSGGPLKVSKGRCVYEPKLIRLFRELIDKCAGLTMNMVEEEESDKLRRVETDRGDDGDRHECDGVRVVSIYTVIMTDLVAFTDVEVTIGVDLSLTCHTQD